MDADNIVKAAAALPLAKAAGDTVKALVVDPVREAVAAHVRAFAEARILPAVQRMLPLPDAAQVAADESAARLRDVSPADLVAPPPKLVADAVTGLQTAAAEPDLRTMFANLLASAMFRPTAGAVHPSFARVLGELAPEDAHLLRLLTDDAARAGPRVAVTPVGAPVTRYQFLPPASGPGTVPAVAWQPSLVSIDNLKRLGLIVDDPGGFALGERRERLEPGRRVAYIGVELTDFGRAFARACFLGPDPGLATETP